jgi:hypothetical protein
MTLSYAQEIKQVSQISVTGRESKSSRSGHHRHGTNKGIMLRKKENDQHIESSEIEIKKK